MDQTERAVQAQWYSTKFMNAQNRKIYIYEINHSKRGDYLSRQDKTRYLPLREVSGASNLNISEEG